VLLTVPTSLYGVWEGLLRQYMATHHEVRGQHLGGKHSQGGRRCGETLSRNYP
jgi:hypothetical protein